MKRDDANDETNDQGDKDNYKISWCIVKNDDNMITW